LREQAWSIVKPYFDRSRRDAVAEYHKSAGTGFTASGLSDVISAAVHGRVRFLFMAENVQFWGKFDPEANTVAVHRQPEKDDEDLLDLAAYQTLNHAGTIYVMREEEVPGSPVSAVLRF
jgi:hypothetical protein